ncbi:MAG: RNA polymerase sigma factor (sigma-70 family) [Verrucomicrobiales bacterium]
MIQQATGIDPDERRRGLEAFCKTYWLPLYAFARHRGLARQDAEDAVQGLIAELIRREDLNGIAPNRGKLRKFLRQAMRNFLSNQWDHDQAEKRGGKLELVSFEHGLAEGLLTEPVCPNSTPEQAFDQHWLLALLGAVMEQLGNRYQAERKSAHFEALKPFLTQPGDAAAYAEIGKKLGISPAAVKVAASRLRKRYRSLVRDEIRLTLGDGENVEAEIEKLIAAPGG